MATDRLSYLYNLTLSALHGISSENVKNILKSHYLLSGQNKCLTNSTTLDKEFSDKVRCQHCLLLWDDKTQTKLIPIKNKARKKKIGSKHVGDKLRRNKLERVCSFCGRSTVTLVSKGFVNSHMLNTEPKINTSPVITESKSRTASQLNPEKKLSDFGVYSSSNDVFKTKSNDSSDVKETKKSVIKNNKRKKDKFAGLCQKAVIASSKLKEEKKKQNILNMFLKPIN